MLLPLKTPTALWSVRNQCMSSGDRLAVLRHQLGVVADDEMRFHLSTIAAECASGHDFPAKNVVVVDPLVAAAWLDPGSFDCEAWAATHPEIIGDGLQLLAVFCVDAHWIPVLITPWDNNARIASWDASEELPVALAACFTRLVHALGFTEIHFDHIPRTFAVRSVCGAVAINFLRSQTTGCHRVGANYAAWEEHHALRNQFMRHLGRGVDVPRPWFWGAGPDEVSGDTGGCSSALSSDSVVCTGTGPTHQAVPCQEVLCHDLGALCRMDSQQLLLRPCPNIRDFQSLFALRKILVPASARLQILGAQFGVWSDDELRFHLHALAAQCNVVRDGQVLPQVQVLDPLVMTSWCASGSLNSSGWAPLYRHVVRRQQILSGFSVMMGTGSPSCCFQPETLFSLFPVITHQASLQHGLMPLLTSCMPLGMNRLDLTMIFAHFSAGRRVVRFLLTFWPSVLGYAVGLKRIPLYGSCTRSCEISLQVPFVKSPL